MSRRAELQQGYVSRAQLLRLGATPAWIHRKVGVGDLIPRYNGVYAVGHRRSGPIPEAAAAVLACGEAAILSHDSAAALWGLGRWPDSHEVIAPHRRRRDGIVAHRSRSLPRRDITRQHGIPVTTPVRTICDIAPRRTDDQLLKAVDDARIQGWLGPDATDELVQRCPRLRGLIGTSATRSQLERAWRRFARRQALPPHELNAPVHGYEVDVYFPAHRLAIELDGWHFHRGPRSFRTDRVRDTVLKDHGIDTVRLTHDRLTDAEGARLHRILDNQLT